MLNVNAEAGNAPKDAGVEFIGLMSKTARIKNKIGKSYEDVLGWDYIYKDKTGVCYKFYIAQEPLIGMTQPDPMECPLGIQAFDHYDVDFKKAIEVLQTMRCGHEFIAMFLSWPLVPSVAEPQWHIRTSIGNDVVIGAFEPKPECYTPVHTLYGMPAK